METFQNIDFQDALPMEQISFEKKQLLSLFFKK